MSDDKEIKPMDHEYDGIQEYDNPLPLWWLVTFFATIIFGFLYWLHYTSGAGQTLLEELKDDLVTIESRRKDAPKSADGEEELRKLAGTGEALARGASVFQAKCAVCHGVELQGLIGPNLVDSHWLHGRGTAVDIAKVIRLGVPDKGMPAWDGQLQDLEIRSLAVFIAGKRGSQPPNPKAPQGDKVEN